MRQTTTMATKKEEAIKEKGKKFTKISHCEDEQKVVGEGKFNFYCIFIEIFQETIASLWCLFANFCLFGNEK